MADPLSVSASISGLVTLADIVFRRTYKYVKAVKKASKEISSLSAEIGTLYGILSNLQLVSHQLEDETFETTTRIHHIHSCYQTLEHVKSILDRNDTSLLSDQRLETFKRKLRWPFTSSEVKDLIVEIERHKTTLGLALNVDSMSGLLQALSKQDQLRNTIEGMRTELQGRHEAETRIAVNKERTEILNSFAKVDPRSNHNMSRKLRSPGTGLWLTEGQEFKQWLDTKNGRLWLYGIPGAGKTILASSMIEEALRRSNPSTAVAFFYCDYKDSATQDLSNILGSLVQQFAKQDEEGFAKLREFYETHNQEHQLNFIYDSDALGSLVTAVTSVFDCAMIIVDGLDECGTNAPLVVDSLTALNECEETTIKTILVSRDEIEIRERLENYTKVSIAARSSDLRLYVAAEIDTRTRKKTLRIRDQSLKEHILERLVEGAEGMFRWVTCQMDYLCEVPNDAARRKALDSLPPDLDSTYERILSRVNQRNSETQKLVTRALRWLANWDGESSFTIEALCEAVSIDVGSTKRKLEAIPDEFEILRCCSSLVRKSADGKMLELSHFTVKEFLTHIGSSQRSSLNAYRIDPDRDQITLANICLTYLNFEDFDQGGPASPHTIKCRLDDCPFRRYAVRGWEFRAHENLNDAQLFSLVQKLLSPSKPNTFISWMHDMVGCFPGALFDDKDKLSIMNSGFAAATALHYAAMLHLADVCVWLIRSGCDANRNTSCGTPLRFALLRWSTLSRRFEGLPSFLRSIRTVAMFDDTISNTIDLLLESGADPNCYYDAGTEKLSPVFIALYMGQWNLAVRLLDRGGVLDSSCLDELENHPHSEDICKLIEHTSDHNVLQENYSRLLELALRAKTSNATRLMQNKKDLPCRNTHYEQILRTAAEFGQMDIVTRLLEDHKLDVDAADESTGFTALHHAVKTDQLEVVQILVDHGANLSRVDRQGRTALHHSVQGKEARCLDFLLHRYADASSRDLENMTVWHLAAQEGNVQALRILLSRPVDSASAICLKANDGRTPLLFASASGYKETLELLLNAGSNLAETASDGSSSLHYAARSGSVEGVKFLIEQEIDPCAVTHDNSSAIHNAIEGNSESIAEIIRILLENGIDPRSTRNDGCTPLHLLVKMIEKEHDYDRLKVDQLFAASTTLVKKLLENQRSGSDVRLASELIHLACLCHSSRPHEVVLDLVELGLDCNIPSANGETALMAAAKSGNGAILSTLLRYGADPCVYSSGRNALHSACLNGHKEILVLLRRTSIDWNSKSEVTLLDAARGNVTALHIASQLRDSSVIEYLLKEGLMSNIDARTNCGETPLFLAAAAMAPQNVSLLLSNNADTTIFAEHGSNAIHWAAMRGFEEVISEFIRHGSDLGLPNSIGLTPELVARKYGHEALANIIMDYVNEQDDVRNTALANQRPGKTKEASEALKVALDIGDLELCKRLVESGTDLGSGFGDCMGCTPLLYSLHMGRDTIAEYLLSQGASTAGITCEVWDTRGFTAFHYAAAWGSVELLRLLLEKSPSEIYLRHDPIHPLHLAVLIDSAECVRVMIDHVSEGKGRTLLDQLGTSREALDRMINLKVQDDMFRWSWATGLGDLFPGEFKTAMPLHIAASKGHLQVVRTLLDCGASIDGLDSGFTTPLHLAAANGQTAVVRLLLDSGANPNALDSHLESPCMAAIDYGDIDSIQSLLNGGADMQLRNRYGQTALHLAARSGASNVLLLVIGLSARYNSGMEDVLGRSVLYEAVSRISDFPMALILNLEFPAEAHQSRIYSMMNAAVRTRSKAEVRMLLRRLPTSDLPIILNHRALYGGTPLHIAATMAKLDVMNLLLDAGAQLEPEGSEHGTALMGACATGRLEAVKLLVARGARTSYVKDGQFYSALLAARHHPEVRRWLLVGRFLEGPKLVT